MRSLKDVKRDIGYIEIYLNDLVIIRIDFLSVSEGKNGFNFTAKHHKLIDDIFRMSNFQEEKNQILGGCKFQYSKFSTKKLKSKHSDEKNIGYLTNLKVINNIAHFTLTN